MNQKKAAEKSAGESIGRPGEWQEGRYQRPGDGQQESVLRKPGEIADPDRPASTPVTQEDYTGTPTEHNTGG